MFRRLLLKALYPINQRLGKIHLPFIHKRLKAAQYREVIDLLMPGMVIVAKRYGEATNLFIPGEFPHAAIACSKVAVVEAIGEGVIKTDLVDFMLSRDRIAVYEPTFCDKEDMYEAASWAHDQIGHKYDYLFETSNKAFYCAELVYDAYSETLGDGLPFKRELILGELTYIPDNIVRNSAAWKLVWEY